jgi:hypothetical protein
MVMVIRQCVSCGKDANRARREYLCCEGCHTEAYYASRERIEPLGHLGTPPSGPEERGFIDGRLGKLPEEAGSDYMKGFWSGRRARQEYPMRLWRLLNC